MVNRDLSVRDNSLTNGSIKVMRYLSIQRDNLKCKKQSPKSLYLRWKPGSRNDPVSNENKTKSVVVFHQNVRGSVKQIRRINNFLVCKLSPGTCLSEHHLRHTKIVFIYVVQYKLGAKCFRESLKNGGVSIFMHDTLQCTSIYLDEFCKEEDIEACAVRINLPSLTIYPYGPYGLQRASVLVQGCTLRLLNYLHYIYL